MRISLVQVTSTSDVEHSIANCLKLGESAVESGGQWLLYPENAPFLGADRSRHEVAEPLDGPMIDAYRDFAAKHGVWITVGGFPEAVPNDPARTYNTQVMIDATGSIHAVYRKIHLFDAQVDKDTAYCESDHVARGDELVVTDVTIDGQDAKVGLSICYDLRFPELYRQLREKGADIVTVPSAFTLQTGRDHWHPLLRARAIENQVYILAPDQYGHHGGSRWSYGHTVVYDPWGHQVGATNDKEGFVTVDLDFEYLRDVRRRMPVFDHRQL